MNKKTTRPFANAKPRDQWKKPKVTGRASGRVKFEACLGYDKKAGEDRYALFVATLTSVGLTRPPGQVEEEERQGLAAGELG